MATVGQVDKVVTRLVYLGRTNPIARLATKLLGIDIPARIPIGPGLKMPHATTGCVIHAHTRIGNNVTIFHGVTIGRSDIWQKPKTADGWGVEIENDAILCAGAVVLVRSDASVVIAEGSIIAANAVLTQSTKAGEIWAGVPARKIGHRAAPQQF